MGALAQMLRKRGFEVRGSDRGAYPPMSTTLAEVGVQIYEGYQASNLDWGPDVVVVGNVIRPTYEEAVALRARNIPHCSLPQALAGLFIDGRHSVVITGTHGKTTTSSMTSWIFYEAGLDPSFMIGGVTGNLGTNHRVSNGGVFIVEGDEYDTAYFDKGPKFLHYRPRTASINNIEFDHADIFRDLDHIVDTFTRFAKIVEPGGRLLVPASDDVACAVAKSCPAEVWLTGFSDAAHVWAGDVNPTASGTEFLLNLPGESPVKVTMPLWGDHNILNALVAAGLAFDLGVLPEVIASALSTFRLPAKRQELKGVAKGIPVIDDFAHHPTAIRETLRAMRYRYPDRRILALFEVESNTSRRRVFQDAFGEALAAADAVYFCSPHEKDDGLAASEQLSLPELIADIQSRGVAAQWIKDVDALAKAVASDAVPEEDIVIAMSGRNFHGIHQMILQAIESGSA